MAVDAPKMHPRGGTLKISAHFGYKTDRLKMAVHLMAATHPYLEVIDVYLLAVGSVA